jgi:hypothetical protein
MRNLKTGVCRITTSPVLSVMLPEIYGLACLEEGLLFMMKKRGSSVLLRRNRDWLRMMFVPLFPMKSTISGSVPATVFHAIISRRKSALTIISSMELPYRSLPLIVVPCFPTEIFVLAETMVL